MYGYTAAESLVLTLHEDLIEGRPDTDPYAPRTILTITDPETGETYRLKLGPAHVTYLEDLLTFGVIS